MTIINTYQAKAQLSQLIRLALAGEDIVIAKAGDPLVKLVPYQKKKQARKPGMLKGKIEVPDDFDEESEEINKLFYGE